MPDIINLYRQAEDYFFKGISSKCLNLCDGAKAYMTGVPVADLNLIYIAKNTNTIDTILTLGEQFYDQNNLSFIVIIPQEFCFPEVENILNIKGYSRKSQSVSMAVKLDKLTVDGAIYFDDGSLIRTNDNQLNDWVIPLVGAFESTIEMSLIYVATHENALKKNINLRHFGLYKQEPSTYAKASVDKPIASITLSLHDGMARIDDVGTLPELQGKGYATRLMRYALSEAKKLGASHCFLESSDSGLGVYQKLGRVYEIVKIA